MEAGEYELTRGTCSIACRLELHAVAGLLRISWCVRMGRNSPCFSFPIFFLRTHTACCKYEATSGLHCLPTSNETRPKERSDRGFFLPIGEKNSSYRGAYRVPLFKLSVCVTFVVYIDCESRTRPIYTNPGSMEANESGLTRGTCFVACRFEVVAVAGLLWISWCVLGVAGFRLLKFVFVLFFLRASNAHRLLQVWGRL